ncbi:hypothetical protein [Chelatococcus reniformis]|uniref:Uncharacterized protein n=1 Tax=Chelatococcus reniformis TaxID=1494448 RepID=A0A916X999_9HYPH|nr:hypothetical protein [Chelatococcus reniformis]GGC56737.1 hypothetical protein GCM10010994_14580 [Chelatococcus reniformis]
MDDVHYREYKILLRPEQFYAASRFEDYWNVLTGIADALGVGVTTNKNAFHRAIREVLFYDTLRHDLYANSFILRKRTFYTNGWPDTEHELTVKFRSPDYDVARAVDITPHLTGEADIKFKEELLPLKNELGGMRSLYSHNCVLRSPSIVLDKGLEHITEVFPVMKRIDIKPKTRIELVNDVAVEELLVDAGNFDFGHGYQAKATISLWRNRASERSLIGEFAFQAKFASADEIHRKAKRLSEDFFLAVQRKAPDWVALGTTKTALVYGIAGKPAAREE